MIPSHARHSAAFRTALLATVVFATVAACGPDRIAELPGGPFAPGYDPRGDAEDGLVVGHRLMAAAQYELALDAFTRAALDKGLTPDIMAAMGTANLGLGRLGQAEQLLRQAVSKDDQNPEVWNNLGVVLMERNKSAEAYQIFRRAYALDNGQSDSIRDNLRLALAKSENTDISTGQGEEYKLVQRGGGDVVIQKNQ